MDLSQSQDLDAVDHWNRAIDAQDAEDYLTAIEEYDSCLCSSPDAETAFEAFYFLGIVIQRAYDLDDEDPDDEQLAWLCCELACCERICEIYLRHKELWPEDQQEAFSQIHFESQALLSDGESRDGKQVGDDGQDLSHVRAAENLGLLRCFSENLSFQFDRNGDPLDNDRKTLSLLEEKEDMVSRILMPKLSPTMEDGQVSRWLKKVGDHISVGEPIAEIDTDKGTMEMQALSAGVLRKILVSEGESAQLGQVIAIIGDGDEEVSGVAAGLSSPQLQKGFQGVSTALGNSAEPVIQVGLGSAMLSLVNRLSEAIREYETTTAGLVNRLQSTLAAANQHLAEGKAHRDTAYSHLQRQSVEPGYSGGRLGTTATTSNGALVEARNCLTRAQTNLRRLVNMKKPQNHGNVFAGLCVPGFIISICAAAGSATGNGGTSFILVNFLFVGLASAIAILRTTSASSEMKSEYEDLTGALDQADAALEACTKFANSEYARELKVFQDRFVLKVDALKKRFAEFYVSTGFVGRSWTDPAWNQWAPAISPAFSACLGTLKSPRVEILQPQADSLLDFAIPALVPFADGSDGKCLLQKATGRLKEDCVRATQALMLRLLANVPPGKVLFTLLDPVGLGQSAAPFMSLADHEEKLITNRAWTEPQHIEEQLGKLTEHMENVIQKYLRNDYSTIEEYNQLAGEVAEPYRVLVVFDFPVNFSETAARRLVSIAKNGPRCGVYTLVVMDTDPSKKSPYGFNLADLENAANVISHDGNRFVWGNKEFGRYTVLLDSPPSDELFKHIVKENGSRATESMRVEVPFEKLLAKAGVDRDSIWQGSTRERIHVPLGPQGAKKLQYLTLGTGTEHHAVCIGMPGSGKTNLMHIIITTMGLMYSPAEMQLYLVDFKQGVGFKRYAEVGLPHAKVIAIDSEREFGLSVLQKLDKELNERGEKFRAAGVDVISDYRQKKPDENLPRILLLVDEFQEFFSYDDNIGTQAGLLLDRLVRQGRYAGIHVMLGSQSLANRSSLPTSTLGQIGIRIALKCGESDARLIMGEGNLQARLLSRPGEAIYNSANGLLEGNSFFQVALFSEEDRNKRLEDIRKFAEQEQIKTGRRFDFPVVFEGNAPARFEECKAFKEVLEQDSRSGMIKSADAWLGEPIAIRAPTAARFRRQGGSNLLIVSRDEEEGVGIALSSLISLLGQYGPDAARFFIFNLTTAESEWNELPQRLAQEFPHEIQMVGRRNLTEVLNDLVNEANRRIEDQSANTREIYFVVLGLHRARDLREDEDGLARYSRAGEGAALDPHALFLTLLREGPESGVHVIAWSDAYAGVARVDRRILGEFSMRVAGPMSNEDSGRVIDDPLASKLEKPHRAVFYDEERPGQVEKFRPYGIPEPQWIDAVGSRIRSRDSKVKQAQGVK